MNNLDSTPRGSRLHIALFGRRNVGKSSLINALTNQELAIVSKTPGTTTDPVLKSMEILPIGPVVLIDTAGIDDTGELGHLRVQKSFDVLNKSDLALLVIDPVEGVGDYENSLVKQCQDKNIPVVGVVNKADLGITAEIEKWKAILNIGLISVSSKNCQGLENLKREIINAASSDWIETAIVGDLISPGDNVILVVPIDKAAPKGRLILPQVQTIRDILDYGAIASVTRDEEMEQAFKSLSKPPRLVITDSQVFKRAAEVTPDAVMLTSFSILFARYKGDLVSLVEGARAIERLKPGSRVLIAEACTHHKQEDDIGTVKIPRLLQKTVGGELNFEWSSGAKLPEDLARFKLIIHCGACMINKREMLHRILTARQAGVPIVNYGVAIAYMLGILKRALVPFPEALMVLEGK